MPIRSTDRSSLPRHAASLLLVALAVTAAGACRKSGPTDRVRVSGHVYDVTTGLVETVVPAEAG